MSRNKTEAATFIGVSCLVLFLIVLALGFFTAFLLMIAWNAVIPAVFNLPELTYWQAFALYWVFAILFGLIRGAVSSNAR